MPDNAADVNVIHLQRNICDGCAMWCDTEEDLPKSTKRVEKSTCTDCLRAATGFGLVTARRLEILGVKQ